MGKKFLVITQMAEPKEIRNWWERGLKYHFDMQIFDTFEEARKYMRRMIAEETAEAAPTLFDALFGKVDLEKNEQFDSFYENGSGTRKIRTLSESLISDSDYFPDQIDDIKETDDADHYHAYVCSEKNVIAMSSELRLEYNIHKMDDENLYYYFEILKNGEGLTECLFSARLINTENTMDNSETVFPDNVKCKQIAFGSYVQSANANAGKAPIVWDVLEEKEDKILVLSHKLLEYRTFNNGGKSARWENSELRKWLNGEFYESAFNEDEKSRILSSAVKNERLKSTEDRVFLLSEEEFYMLGSDNRSALLTSLARAQYSEVIDECYSEPYGFWWLRSRGADVKGGYDLMHVCANGLLNSFARSDSSHPNGIRPAMWIKK